MKQHLRENLKAAKTLDKVCQQMNIAFEEVKKETSTDRIGYVAGIIFSDGPEFVEKTYIY